ncbi:glycosyl transferase group 1 [Desulfatibacillum aliphaticivorans]|uniref:Glycosyl transferase group 1 n=1 Tax=Desulfatibacillum aliphaticivorans TaxID=218208 RepID=B8F9T9_DESAL|nr:glycosyltransferase family 4 protein [Desulfatibacillum aliphaticivorans]ACL03035.1 glycosyl transferase group 1 [Desulfatibacillum aliphaticivorans]
MHILFLTDNFPPEVNAPASRTFEHCKEWVGAGHRVTVITGVPNFPHGRVYPGYHNKIWQQDEMAGIRVIRVWTYIAANAGFAKRIVDYISYMITSSLAALFEKEVDIVIGTSPQLFTTCGAYIVSRVKGKPYIFELRDLWPESIKAVGAMKNSPILNFFERLELFLYRSAAGIVSVTNSFKLNLMQRGISGEKIEVITNGVDLSKFNPVQPDEELKSKLGIAKNKFVAGYIGTHGMAHALETILMAAKELQNKPNGELFHFIFIGDGSEKKTLKRLANEFELNNVTFIDSVPKEEVVKYWGLLDVSIVHLKRTELFETVIPSKIFESMGMGIPILLGVAGESAEIVNSDRAGITFEPENPRELMDKLQVLRNNEKLYNQLKANGLKASKKYDRSLLAADMLQKLCKVASSNSSSQKALSEMI